jgi:hypothetical protein
MYWDWIGVACSGAELTSPPLLSGTLSSSRNSSPAPSCFQQRRYRERGPTLG